jgi:broad specificity polyphosphatase/5'/3'-nucleotidase SurE
VTDLKEELRAACSSWPLDVKLVQRALEHIEALEAGIEAEKVAVIEMLTGMQTGIDIVLSGAQPGEDITTLRFASGFVGGIIENIQGDLHRGVAAPKRSSIIMP